MKTIRIKDYYGIYQEIPVSDELYEEWRALQNETQRVHRKEVYHRDWTPIEDLFEMPKSYEQNPMEDTLLWDEQVAALYAAIAQLTPIQQRRIHTHQIRDYTTNKQNQVDDYPYGGGRGAVMQCDPLYRCWAASYSH